jgi:glyoxylase-like metal-dependent hydrolase (beta-lactamase superfamily II)
MRAVAREAAGRRSFATVTGSAVRGVESRQVQVRSFIVGPLQSNSYLVIDERTRRAALIDPGMESEGVLEVLRGERLILDALILTHGHFDHVSGNDIFKAATGAQLVMHPEDLPLLAEVPASARFFGFTAPEPPRPDRLVREGDVISVGGLSLTVLETPGHTPGSISLHLEDAVFVGDTLFAGSVGRTDLAGGSQEVLLRSIRTKLLTLPDRTVVYAGHGPATTIGAEREANPFLRGGG